MDTPCRECLPGDLRDLLCAEGPMRQELQRWLHGEIIRAELPVAVLQVVSSFAFTPVAERCVEAQHSIMKKHLGFNRAGPLACSVALRSGTLIAPTLTQKPEMLRGVVCMLCSDTAHPPVCHFPRPLYPCHM